MERIQTGEIQIVTEWQATWQKFIADYTVVKARADRVRGMMHARAKRIANEAGLDLGCALHNAFIGEPWKEVDYPKARLARRILENSFLPERIAERWWALHYPKAS